MASTIVTKNSSTASAAPVAGDLVQGELAVNVTDKKLYTKDSGGSVVKIVGGLGNQEKNAVDITGGTVAGATISGYTESVTAIGTVSSSSTLSIASATVLTATLTASTACTFTMPTATAGKSFVLLLKQAASTGNGTATFTGVKWPTAGAPTITATAGKMDILTFIADGTNWYGAYTQGYTP
jgi:hypothetical protein